MRNEIAQVYNQAVDDGGKFGRVRCAAGCKSSYYKYPLILGEDIDRNRFTQILMDEFGVETGNVFYPPSHLQTIYKKLTSDNYSVSLPVAEKVLTQTITLPMHAALTTHDAEYVMDSCNNALQQMEMIQ
jgi:dTDP-4-amino-4,6-dideoxygalactose transaminase